MQDPSWSYATGLRSPTGARNLTSVDRVSLEYFDHGNPNNVSVRVQGPNGSQTRSVVLTQGGVFTEGLRSRDAWFRFSDVAIGLEISGSGEFHVRAHDVDLWVDPVESRGL